MLLLPLGSSAGYKVQGVQEDRGVKAPAFSFPDLPPLEGHIFFLVTPSGKDGVYFRDAIGDLLHMSTWVAGVFATSEKGQSHMHYLVALPASCVQWLSKHRTIFRSGRYIPCVTYSRDTGEGCDLSFSEITNVDGLKKYLEGPRNNAKFVNLLDPSPRAVWQLFPDNRLEERQEGLKSIESDACRHVLHGLMIYFISPKTLNNQKNNQIETAFFDTS